MKHPYFTRLPDPDESSVDEENAGVNDLSMDSSLPSVAPMQQLQVFPIPPRGARSLAGGSVALDGESVEIEATGPVAPSGPPSVVDISASGSSIGPSFYDNIMTFKILGTQNDTTEHIPTLPANGNLPPLVPPSILRNPIPKDGATKQVAGLTPRTDVSLLSSMWNTPVKEVSFFPRCSARSRATARGDSLDYCMTGCCPYWIQRSPLWLKVFLLVSAVLLLASTCLIGIAVAYVVSDKDDATSPITTGSDKGIPPPTLPTASTPKPPLKDDVFVTGSTAQAPGVSTPTVFPTFAPSSPTTYFPTEQPSGAPVPVPSTFAPTVTIDRNVVTFMVTAGTWDATVDPALVLPRLPVRQDRAFMVHLGDWNVEPDCPTDAYSAVADLWSQSACPVYFVVGRAETNDCPSPTTALRNWRDVLVDFHRQFWSRPRWTFWDDQARGFEDAWVFDTNGIAIAGLHLTAGGDTPGTGRLTATEASLAWIDENYDFYRRGGYRNILILLANTAVDDPAHADFFATLLERVETDYDDMRFVWVQPAANEVEELPRWQASYQNLTNFDVLSVKANVWPPMRIQINPNDEIVVDQEEWFNDHTGLNV